MASIDLTEIRHALAIARDRGFGEVELESGAYRFRAVLGTPKPTSRAPQAQETLQDLVAVASPVVGFLGKIRPALKEGAQVHAGEVLAVVVSLGLPTDLEASCTGEIVAVHASDGDAVEYGQVIAEIRRTDAKA